MFKCVIVDDECYAVDVLSEHIRNVPSLRIVKIYTDPLLALTEILKGEIIDIVFLDINMPRLSGIALASAIKSKARRIIYSTAHREYAYSAYESGADAYLLKPYDLSKFLRVINKVLSDIKLQELDEDFFLVKSSEEINTIKIRYTDIYAVESMQNYVKIHLKHQAVITYMSLNELLAILTKRIGFVQLHRSFAVALKCIETINGNVVELNNGLKFNVGAKFKKTISEYIEMNLITSIVQH